MNIITDEPRPSGRGFFHFRRKLLVYVERIYLSAADLFLTINEGELVVFKEGKFKAQRQPKRSPLTATAAVFIGGGILLSITFIGAVVGIPMILIGLIVLFIRSRIKVTVIDCPSCKTPNKVEPSVKYFNCEQCSKTIRQEDSHWIAV